MPLRSIVPAVRAALKLGAVLASLNLSPVGAAEPATGDCRLAVLGDSLTSGYGVALEEAFPARLEAALRAAGFICEVIDAGVSGDTSAGGRARLAWALADEPTHLLVELGGNDGLRALPVEQLEDNLDAILREARARGIPAFLVGMEAPPNLGRAYTEAFRKVYVTLAGRYDTPLYPFFLDGVITRPELMQPDGIHPNAAGVEELVRAIVPKVTGWLRATGVDPGGD